MPEASATVPDTFRGTWQLVAFAEATGEARLGDDELRRNQIDGWLNGGDDALVTAARPVSGLTLSIRTDGSFDEQRTGSPAVTWFDAEGVLTDEAVPFGGTTESAGETLYLLPAEIPSWAHPEGRRHGNARLRYDDGDTKIADGLTLTGDRLVRTINVVTDELYFNRIVLLYAR